MVWNIEIEGLYLEGDEYTYKPAEDSLIIYKWIDESLDRRYVLYDVGTGSGILSLLAARKSIYSIGIDMFYEAVSHAYVNSIRNGLDEYTDYIAGDLLEPLRLDIDNLLIVSNPPYLPGYPESPHDHLYLGGEGGISVIRRLLEYFRLSNAREMYIVSSSYTMLEGILKSYKEYGINMRRLKEYRFNDESIYLNLFYKVHLPKK